MLFEEYRFMEGCLWVEGLRVPKVDLRISKLERMQQTAESLLTQAECVFQCNIKILCPMGA